MVVKFVVIAFIVFITVVWVFVICGFIYMCWTNGSFFESVLSFHLNVGSRDLNSSKLDLYIDI